jgi:hypothetical protein
LVEKIDYFYTEARIKQLILYIKHFQILSAVQIIVFARPEPPRNRFSQNLQQHPPFLRQQQLPRQGYAPAIPSDSYGENFCFLFFIKETENWKLKNHAGTPVSSYGPPPDKQIEITKNVYVHLPPEDPEDYQPPAVIEAPPPRKHCNWLIFWNL